MIYCRKEEHSLDFACLSLLRQRLTPVDPESMPTEIQLEKALRNAVRAHFRDPEQVESSPNALRAHAEKELGLEDGFFKNGDWKARSKEIIQDQFVCISQAVVLWLW